MALPATISCKVSSESAGYLTMSAVTRVDVPLDDLAARILGICGKDPRRVAGILRRGALVSGDIRYRWQPLQPLDEDVAALLQRFPDHDPDLELDAPLCFRMVFRGPRGEFEITREAGQQRRFLRRRAFWDEAVKLIATLSPRCQRHSYSDGADVFAADLTPGSRATLRALGSRLRYTALAAQLRNLPPGRVMLFVERRPTP